MTDLEKELVEKLAIEEQRPFYGATQDIADMSIEVARKRVEVMFMPLIRSHTQALVAVAYAACAKTCLGNVLSEEQMNGEPNLHVGEMCLRLCHERDAAAIRKLTPADAARELERVKASSFLVGQAEECGGTPKGIVQASARGKEK